MELTRHLINLYLLVCVIDAGGFSDAAREMGTTRSLLSRHVIELENVLDIRLLHRDARHFAVTPAGEEVYRHAVLMCDAAQAAIAAANALHDTGRGLLRIHMSGGLSSLMAGLLTAYADQHPQMQMQTRIDSNVNALVRQQTDVLLTQGGAPPDSADIIAHTLGRIRQVIVASPDLLKQLGYPQHPSEIEPNHHLAYTGHEAQPAWVLHDGNLQLERPRMISDRLAPVIEAARAGMGLAQLPMYTCHAELASGRLQPVFEALEPEPMPLYALTLAGRGAGKTPVDFTQFMRERLAGVAETGVLPVH